ncbi:MAG: phosphate starvation-inducible protein PsiF [Beijerinckiaceae bacterium]|nr:phosphate starvation-inducible protein PsiF [Beijerinckiaceae bacterium]
MTTFGKYLGLIALAASLGAAPSFAQPAPTASGKSPAAETKAAPKPRTEKSIECSKQADAKKLHGAERKKFREECKKAG